MTINFPAPSPGATYNFNNVEYEWDGTKWVANYGDSYVYRAGDTMTGDLNLPNLVATGDIQSTSQNGGPLAGFRNQIINGSFIVRQRMPVQTPTNYNDNDFVEDRWSISSDNSSEIGGVEVTVQNSNSGPINQRSILRVRPGTATATTAKLVQPIELNIKGYQYPFQVGTQWTLSFWYNGATDFTTQNCRAIFRRASGLDTNQLLAAPNTTGVVIQTDGSWNKYAFTFTIGGDMAADAGHANFTCLDIVINNFDITASSFFTDIQFEPGPVATPFEHRPIGTELALCQRFYQIRTSGTTDPLNLRPTMRTTPTVSGNTYDAEL